MTELLERDRVVDGGGGLAVVRRGPPWRSVLWAAVRLQRHSLLPAGLVTAAVLAFAVIARQYWDHAGAQHLVPAPSCVGSGPGRCLAPSVSLADARLLMIGAFVALVVYPVAVGVILGGPALGGEWLHRVNRFFWVQGVGRGRWVAARLLVALGAACAGAGVVSVVVSTWWLPGGLDASRIQPWGFDISGVVPVATALLACALAALLAAVGRRVVPAVVVALALGGAGIGVFQTVVRPHLVTPAAVAGPTVSWRAPEYRFDFVQTWDREVPLPPGSWFVAESVARPGSSQLLAPSTAVVLARSCDWGHRPGCPAPLHEELLYQPVGHYWPLQDVQAAIFLGATVVLGAAAVVVTRRASA